jgi:DNA-binding transcriptional LysR family regulator
VFDRAGRRLSLTDEGRKLMAAAEKLESIILRDVLTLNETRQEVSGRVRVGTTEGFGCHYLARRLPALLAEHPGLEIELVAMPRTFSLGMREVDLVIAMDRPESGDVRFKKLTPYMLALYGSSTYFESQPYPASVQDLGDHLWCGYIDELLFTQELDMMHLREATIKPRFRTTSVTVQLEAVQAGAVLAILPCYMAAQYPLLEAVLPETVSVELNYWMSVHGDLADSPRVRAVMDGIERMVHQDKAVFMSRPIQAASPASL